MARIPPDDLALRLGALVNEHIRQHNGIATDDLTGEPIIDFTPPLTAQEQTTLAALTDVARSPIDLTPGEWDRIRPNLQALRDLRQLGRNAFLALTAAERDRRLYDAQTDTTIILLALLRSNG